MKTLSFLLFCSILFFSCSKKIEQNPTIGQSVIIQNLEIAQFDFDYKLDFDGAKIACNNLGYGWRLPNKTELNTLQLNRDKISSFKGIDYWSSTDVDTYTAWSQNIINSIQVTSNKSNSFSVRAVRAF